MNKRSPVLAAAIVLMIVGVSIGLLALFRIQQAREFSERHEVRMHGGTNYAVRLLEATVGKVDKGYVLIVYLRLENHNPFDVTLQRERFLLVDSHRRHYTPSISGGQREMIQLPANGVLDREMLSFIVPDDALAGGLLLVTGENYRIRLKDRTAFSGRLRVGEFRSFRRHSW